jgi:hypothetical protein
MITTLGIYSTHADAEAAIKELKGFGVVDADISYVYVNSDGQIKDDNNPQKVGEGTVTGASTGAVLGALAGFVVASGVLPGLGSIIAAGPLIAALGLSSAAATAVAGAAIGATAGGLIGALGNFGVSNADANLYEALVRQGDILIIARSSAETKSVFAKTNAKEVREYIS